MAHVIPTGYIYAHRSKLTNRVMYIGLSFNNSDNSYSRAFKLRDRNKHHTNIIKKYGINKSTIRKCCMGLRLSAGKHPATNERLIWSWKEQPSHT